MNFEVIFTSKAESDIKDLPKNYQVKIIEEIFTLKHNITPDGKRIKKIQGVDFLLYRLRVGEYRVLFTPMKNKVYLLKIIHRKILERVVSRIRLPKNCF